MDRNTTTFSNSFIRAFKSRLFSVHHLNDFILLAKNTVRFVSLYTSAVSWFFRMSM